MKTDIQRIDPHALRPLNSADFGDLEPPDTWALDDFLDLVPSAYERVDTVLPRRTSRRGTGAR